MSIRSVVTRGYANGGSIALVAVRGYGKEAGGGGGAPGAWALGKIYDRYEEERKQFDAERKEKRRQIAKIKDETDAEIARLLHKGLEYEARTLQIEKLEQMVATTYSRRQAKLASEYNEAVYLAYEKAYRERTFAALEAFERAIEQARREEEEFLMLVIAMME